MSKFQAEYSIVRQFFEDFILVVYVLVDDLYKKVAPRKIFVSFSRECATAVNSIVLVAITTSAGAVKAFEITPANVDDRKGLEDLSLVVKADSVIIGDKGYVIR